MKASIEFQEIAKSSFSGKETLQGGATLVHPYGSVCVYVCVCTCMHDNENKKKMQIKTQSKGYRFYRIR